MDEVGYNSTMEIVKPDLTQIPELLTLWRSQYEFHHSLDDEYYVAFSPKLEKEFRNFLEKAINDGYPHILIAKEGQELLGFITFEEDSEEYFDTQIKKFGVVVELYVTENSRMKGVGKELMNAAERYFASKGLKHIKLASSTFNGGALDFYNTLAYVNR